MRALTRRMARAGQPRAAEQALQFAHRSCRIWRKSEPLPNAVQPFTHFAQPMQSFSSIVYS